MQISTSSQDGSALLSLLLNVEYPVTILTKYDYIVKNTKQTMK